MNEMNLGDLTERTREMLAKSILQGMKDGSLKKAISTSTGLTGINLEAPAKQLVALLSPFRQSIPRVVRSGATASQFKRITAISTPKITTTESAAGAAYTTTVGSVTVNYKVMGLRGEVTREAVAASEGFDPALAKETANTLLNYMKIEEQYMLGGNVTALATPGAPTSVAVVSTGGTMAAAASGIKVWIAALTLPAANRVTIRRPIDWDGTDANIASYSIVASPNTIDGLTGTDGCVVGGTGTTSAALSGSTNRLRIAWAPVAGAAAYIVFAQDAAVTTVITGTFAQCIVTQTKITLTSLTLSANVPGSAAATSADSAAYDGIIPQILAAGSGAYISALSGKLSGTASTGEITELADAMSNLFDNSRLGKLRIVCAGQEARAITARGAVSNSLNIITQPLEQGRMNVTFGAHVGQIINPVTGDMCPVEVAPWLTGGTLLLLPIEIPYPDSNTPAPFDMAMGYDVERWDYSSTTSTGPVYPFEVRSYGALRAVFTGACGIISDIYKG